MSQHTGLELGSDVDGIYPTVLSQPRKMTLRLAALRVKVPWRESGPPVMDLKWT